MKYLTVILLFSFLRGSGQEKYLLVGTYDSPKSEGIYVYRFNCKTGEVKEISHIKTANPSFITVSPNERYVYAVHETAPQSGKGGDVAAFRFNKKKGILELINRQLTGGDHPCHVETDKTGSWLFVSNYTSGSLSVLPVTRDGSLGTAKVIPHYGSGKHTTRQKGPHTHGAIMGSDNRQLFVTDLGIDKVMLYSFEAKTGTIHPSEQSSVSSVPGSGPRLMTFHPDHSSAYVIEELSGTVQVYEYKNNKLSPKQRISTLPEGDTSFAGSADIHISPDGKFLYASNRGDVNTIAIFQIREDGTLSPLGHQPTLGKTPRNFSLDPTGNFLLCENQNSDEIVIFSRDQHTGLLKDTGKRIPVGKPVCIKWISVK